MGENVASVDKDLKLGIKTTKRSESKQYTSFNEATFNM